MSGDSTSQLQNYIPDLVPSQNVISVGSDWQPSQRYRTFKCKVIKEADKKTVRNTYKFVVFIAKVRVFKVTSYRVKNVISKSGPICNRYEATGLGGCPCRSLKADSYTACRAHATPMPFSCHAVPMPRPCRALIHTRHAAPLPCSESAVSFVKVRVVAGNIRTASPTV